MSDIIGLLGGTADLIKSTKSFYSIFKDAKGQPEEFRNIAAKFPLVLQILENAENEAQRTKLDDGARNAAEDNIKTCKEKVETLNKIFKAVLRKDDDNWLERYKKAIATLGKGERAEQLMREIMEYIKLVTCDKLMGTATSAQFEQLQEAIQEMLDLPSSITEDSTSITQYHTGAGHNYANTIANSNTGSAPQINSNAGGAIYYNNKFSSQNSTTFLQSLAFLAMDSHEKDIPEAAENTCEWLLDEPEYEAWLSQSQRLLWIVGIPGSGKSTLMKYIYQQDKSRREPKEATLEPFERTPKKLIVASFFCYSAGILLQKNRTGLFRSLLHQILQQIPTLPYEIALDFEKRCNVQGKPGDKWEWHERDLEIMLETSMSCISKEYPEEYVLRIYVDALDEFSNKESSHNKQLRDLAEYFTNLTSLDRPGIDLSVCISSRVRPDIVGNSLLVSFGDKNHRDILTYVQNKLSGIKGEPREAQKLVDWIVNTASGIFQWAVIVVETAKESSANFESPKGILESLKELPQGLDNLYQKSFVTLGKADRPRSLRLLRWVCFAQRPLSVEELHDEMEFSQSTTTPRKSVDNKRKRSHHEMANVIKSLSCNLTVINNHDENYTVQLRHQSVHDYLVSHGLQYLNDTSPTSSSPPSSATGCEHLQLLTSCIFYMASKEEVLGQCNGLQALLDGTGTNQTQIASSINAFQDICPFSRYAATHWAHHASLAEKKNPNEEYLLQLYQWLPNTLFVEKFNKVFNGHFLQDRGMTLLHIASRQGLLRLVELILRPKNNPTATSITLNRDLRRILDKFMAKLSKKISTEVDINIRTISGQTPLIVAIRGRHEAVAKLLLQNSNADVDTITSSGETALISAVKAKQQTIVTLLLDRAKIDINRGDQFGYTALIIAVILGHEGIVKLLLQHRKINVNAGDMFRTTALLFAIQVGNESIVRDILKSKKADIDISAKNMFNQSPLNIAIRNKHWNTRTTLHFGVHGLSDRH